MGECDPLLGRSQSQEESRLALCSLGGASILLSYFSIGLAQALPETPLIYFLVQVKDVSASRMGILAPVASLPWCLKLVYGMISDCYPINGQRRKPYFIIASCLFADVAADSLIVERSKRIENKHEKGTMQSTCYLLRFTGQVLGSIVGATCGDPTTSYGLSISTFFLLSASVGIAPLVFSPFLVETTSKRTIKPLSEEISAMVGALSHQAVYQPMSFIVVYNLLQWTNNAWINFLVQGLHFSETQLGYQTAAGSIFNWLGIATYKRYFIHSSWRSVYFGTAILSLIFTLLQAVLVLRLNLTLGVSDIWFSVGDTTVATFITAMQFLPAVMMYVNMCPDGSEGSVYALLTTMSNLAGVCSSNVSTLLTYYWPLDISNSAFRNGNFSGVLWLTLFTAIINPIPLILLSRLPATFEEQEALRIHGKKNRTIGVASLYLVAVAIAWTFIQNSVVAIYAPD